MSAAQRSLQNPVETTGVRRTLLVLGMHRSGTSALTRVLSLLGADLPRHLVPALPGDNDTGFWESKDLVAVNEEIFAAVASDWGDMRSFPAAWHRSPEAEEFKFEALRILARDFSDASLFVLKDPRICRLLPFWLSVFEEFGSQPSCVFILRNPLEVAASLKARSGLSKSYSCSLWLRHLVDAECATRDVPRCFVTYDQLLEDWRLAAEVISESLEIDWPQPPSAVTHKINDFLSDRHRHHRFTTADLDGNDILRQQVQEMHRAFLAAVETQEDAELQQASNAARAHLTNAESLLGPALTDSRTSGLTRELDLRDQKLRHLAMDLLRRNVSSAHQAERLERLKNPGFLTLLGVEGPPPPHPLFDRDFYLKQNPEVANHGLDPWLHFLEIGRPHRCAPHPLFDIAYYLKQAPEIEEQGLDPLAHFFEVGAAKGLNPHPLFDTAFYLRHHPEAARGGYNPLTHFLDVGATQGANPHPLFDTSFYLDHDPGIAAAGYNALAHYLEYGAVAMHDPHPLFDTPHFLLAQPESISQITIPLLYFLDAQNEPPCDPPPLFSNEFYLEQRPEQKPPDNPLKHFLEQGATPDRNPHPLFDVSFYLEQAPDLIQTGTNPLVHYLRQGAGAGLNPHPDFDTSYYLSTNPDVGRAGTNPLLHYVLYGSRERRRPNSQTHT